MLPGYSVLLRDDSAADHLTDLDWPRRIECLFDLSLLGEAVQGACRPNGLRRINYEVLGNSLGFFTTSGSGSATELVADFCFHSTVSCVLAGSRSRIWR